jgi:hypothetical protein
MNSVVPKSCCHLHHSLAFKRSFPHTTSKQPSLQPPKNSICKKYNFCVYVHVERETVPCFVTCEVVITLRIVSTQSMVVYPNKKRTMTKKVATEVRSLFFTIQVLKLDASTKKRRAEEMETFIWQVGDFPFHNAERISYVYNALKTISGR